MPLGGVYPGPWVAFDGEAGAAATDDVSPVPASVSAAAADTPSQSARRIHRLDDFIPSSLLLAPIASGGRPAHPGGRTRCRACVKGMGPQAGGYGGAS